MYIELRTDYQGLILPIPMVVYIMDTFISTDFCLKKLHNFQEFGHQPPDWLREIASSSGMEFILPLLSMYIQNFFAHNNMK